MNRDVTIIRTDDEGAILLDEGKGVYWELNSSASDMVIALRDGQSLLHIVELIAERYDVPAELVEQDLAAVIDQLVQVGIGHRS